MIRVLHIINHLNIGGAERMLVESIKQIHQTQKNVKQYVITVFHEGELMYEIKQISDIETLCLSSNRFNFILKIPQLKKFIKKNQIDIIHTHLYEATILSRLARTGKAKIITTIHNGFHDPKSILFSKKRLLLDKLTFNRTYHSTIFVSNSVKKEFEQGFNVKHQTFIIPNFASTKFTPLYKSHNHSKLKLISLGRLIAQKNQIHLIKALKQLNNVDIELDIYGNGPLEAELKAAIGTSRNNIQIKKSTEISSELLAGYDAFIMSSIEEGMSIALIEALSVGMPSILTNIPSFAETAGNAALYFTLEDNSSLSQLLKRIYEQKHILNDLADQAQIIRKKYSIESYTDNLLSTYNQLLY